MSLPVTGHAPAVPARDTRVDVVRGWMQLTIFTSHAQGSFAGMWLIHGAWGLSDSSEQFVLLSGLALGSVFARKHLVAGWRPAALDMLRRAARLWRTHLVVMALFGAMLFMVGAFIPGEAEGYGWGYLTDHPARAVLAAVALVYQPSYVDALSVFVWSMLALPGFMWAVARVGGWALMAPALLWAAAQTGWLPSPDVSGTTPPGFDPVAWQALFMLGAWLGRRKLLHGTALPRRPWMLPAAGLVLAAGLAMRLQQHGFLPAWTPPLGLSFDEKAMLSLPRIVHALALAYVVARLMPADGPWVRRPLALLLARAGRHSLQVFCAGLFLSYAVSLALRLLPGWAAWLDPVLIVGGCAALLLWPAALAWRPLSPGHPRHLPADVAPPRPRA